MFFLNAKNVKNVKNISLMNNNIKYNDVLNRLRKYWRSSRTSKISDINDIENYRATKTNAGQTYLWRDSYTEMAMSIATWLFGVR